MFSKARNMVLILALTICVDANHANAGRRMISCVNWVVKTLKGRTYLRPEVWTARRNILVTEKAKSATEYRSAMKELAQTASREDAEVSIQKAYEADVRYCNAHNEIAEQEDGLFLAPLDRYYVGENLAKSFYTWDRGAKSDVLVNVPIGYLKPEQASIAQVFFKDGKAFSGDGKLIADRYGLPYIMNEFGEIYTGAPFRGQDLDHRHSSLNGGRPVAAAGNISFDKNGKIIRVSRASGHYKPSKKLFRQFLEQLRANGMDLSGAEISWTIAR